MNKLLNTAIFVWSIMLGFIVGAVYGLSDIRFWIVAVLNCVLVIIVENIVYKIIE